VLVDTVALALRGCDPVGDSHVLRAGTVSLDPHARSAAAGDRPVALTATEFDLLQFLMSRPGRVFTREQLLEAAWEPGASAGNRTVDVHIAQLRAKLGAASPIRTVRGVGYAVDP
jgi:DNA-binding response OmpR family regulator